MRVAVQSIWSLPTATSVPELEMLSSNLSGRQQHAVACYTPSRIVRTGINRTRQLGFGLGRVTGDGG